MNYLNKIKWAYQRVFRGYDDRITWDIDIYLAQLLPGVKSLCEQQLSLDYMTEELNPHHYRVFTTILKMINEYEQEGVGSMKSIWIYIADNLDSYWS